MAGQGYNKLAKVLHKKMKGTNQNQDQMELGKILDDLSLQTDLFPIPIPKGEYLITRQLTHKTTEPLTETSTDDLHKHNVILPESMYPLKAGDRVLVAWVNQGTDPVIIDIVVSS